MTVTPDLLAHGAADICLVTSDENVRYVTGFTGGDASVLVTPEGSILFTDSRYAQQATQETEQDLTEIRIVPAGKERLDAVADVLRAFPCSTIGLEEQTLSVAQYRMIENALESRGTADISELLLQLRAIKSPYEIECIRTAASATNLVMERIAERIGAGMSEYDIRAEVVYAIASLDMEPSFDPIVAAGPNGAMPHAVVSDYVVKKGDFVTLDFGCRYKGYCADMTRTLAVGHVDGELKTIYDVVEHAQKAAEMEAQIGVAARKIDETARQGIREAGYAENFGHGTGHGVGLQIHELPVINRTSDAVIVSGMAYTIEPGIYVEGLGGVRIEDTCVAGIGSLFSFPKRIIELD